MSVAQDAACGKWSLTQNAFDGLLSALGPDREQAAGRYLEIRRNVVRLFEWRGCSTPEEYADETLNRCARKIAGGEEIRDVATYCVGIARMLVREMSRDRTLQIRSLEEAPEPQAAPQQPAGVLELRIECLRRCLDQLPPETRSLVLGYYRGDKADKIKNRQAITRSFGVPASTLRMRVLRLRERLQACVEKGLRRRAEDAL